MRDFLLKTAHLNRSIICNDFEKTLNIINKRIPLKIHKYPSGTQCFDWIIPQKWLIRDAYIKDDTGKKILDWKKNPLHVITGSLPINKRINKKQLLKRINIAEDYPEEIPYQFKFYELDWGFCLSKKETRRIKGDKFHVFIDAEYIDDNLLVGEHIIKGKTQKSLVLMAHIDHPAQVNDGLAGVAVLLKLAEKLQGTSPQYTLRFQFLPERIGSIAYLHHNIKRFGHLIGGIFCDMPGTPKYPLVLQYSKWKNTRLDRTAKFVLNNLDENTRTDNCFRGVINDDGVYNSPGIDIPCISLSRSKRLATNHWRHHPFYHTSGDNLENFNFVQARKFLEALETIVYILNKDKMIIRKYTGIPNLSRHNLWVDRETDATLSSNLETILYELDNKHSILDICQKHNLNFNNVERFIKNLANAKLVKLESTASSWFSPDNPFKKLSSRNC